MKLKFFGVRGSYPVPDIKMMKYGGRTSSVMFSKEMDGKLVPLFIDAGIGIIEAGRAVLPLIFADKCLRKMNVFFTHLHPDHSEGFTFFAPNFLPKIELNLLGMSALKKNVGMVLRDKMTLPTYPIEYKDLKSERKHFIVTDGEIFYINSLGEIAKTPVGVTAYIVEAMQAFAPSHPQQGAIYYKITDPDTGKSVVCIWDNESRKGGDQRVIAFSKGAEIMIHDTQYTDEEYDSSKMIVQGFGHSTFSMAIENAVKAGVKKLIPFHYNPNHTDQILDGIFDSLKKSKLEIIPSREGLELVV
jgi:ribonuclease BN (tRNA processing enzyme)